MDLDQIHAWAVALWGTAMRSRNQFVREMVAILTQSAERQERSELLEQRDKGRRELAAMSRQTKREARQKFNG